MIIDLPSTSTGAISTRLRELREERGEIASGRVLTLIVVTDERDDLDRTVDAIHDASREHPARVIVFVTHKDADGPTLDAQLRIGGDSGASEMIIMHLHGELAAHRASVVTPLLLPDTPIVAWWPTNAPKNPALDPIGALATRRITDSFHDADSSALLKRRATYTRGDSDIAWSRITLWRGLLASALDQPPHHAIVSAEVTGPKNDPSVDLAAGWLAERLGVPVVRYDSVDEGELPQDDDGLAMISVEKAVLRRQVGAVEVTAVDASTVRLTVGETESLVTLSRRPLADCIAEELRHLDPDYAFGHALRGLAKVTFADSPEKEEQLCATPVVDACDTMTDRWTSRPIVSSTNAPFEEAQR